MAGKSQLRRSPAGVTGLSFAQFRQVVRRYRPSDLLPALAELAVLEGEPPYSSPVLSSAPPWAIALAARESVLWGNEHRRAPVTGDSLRLVFNAHNEIHEGDPSSDANGLLDMLTRLAYEQFPYQESMFEEVSRSHALLVEGAAEIPVEVLNDVAWHQIFDSSLGEVVGATFLLQVAANNSQGWFDFALLERDDLQPIFDLWPRSVIEHRAAQLSCTFPEFRAAYDSVPHPPPGYERYAYNPLTKRPFLQMPDGRLLAPQPRLILRTVTPGSLYYQGMERFEQPFARDLGHLTEHYVGKQLQSIGPDLELHPEIIYIEGRSELKSVDWFVIFPSVVILFEVKSARFGLLERAAFGSYKTRVQALLNKATAQLVRSSDAIDAGNPQFAHIPKDRPRIGIIVTGEPHYLANSPWMRDLVDDAPFPTITASLRDIEMLAGLGPSEVERQLKLIATDSDRSTWNLGNALDKTPPGNHRNSLLQRAWESYPWPTALVENAAR